MEVSVPPAKRNLKDLMQFIEGDVARDLKAPPDRRRDLLKA
jgi:hypothetical protein